MPDSKDLKGAHVAIVGLGNTQGTFTSSVANGKSFDEVWAINSMMAPIKHDRVFMMDPASRFLDTENAGSQTKALRKILGSHPGPIYTCTLDERVPGAVLYPLEEVVKDTGLCYFNNTVPYIIAFAIYHKVAHIYLSGIDYSYKSNIVMAEAGRACTEFWLSAAVARGMKVEIAQDSSLLDTNVPDEEKLYGYHRLADPLIVFEDESGLHVKNISEIEITKKEQKPVLVDRNDSHLKPPEPNKW